MSATDVEKQTHGQSVNTTKKGQDMGGRCNEETKNYALEKNEIILISHKDLHAPTSNHITNTKR